MRLLSRLMRRSVLQYVMRLHKTLRLIYELKSMLVLIPRLLLLGLRLLLWWWWRLLVAWALERWLCVWLKILLVR